MSLTGPELAATIDHTLLRPDATANEIHQLCDEAIELGFASVCVNSRWVPLAAQHLRDETPVTCSVVGFPLGAMATEIKAAEAAWAEAEGARELDMVLDLGSLRSGDDEIVRADIAAVVAAAPHCRIKVILETASLEGPAIDRACALARDAGAHFVKTSTGFGPGGASLAAVRRMRAAVGNSMAVKASGGIRDRPTALAMLEAGADRLGSSSGVAILAVGDGS